MRVKMMGIINVSPESFYKGSVKVREEEIEHTVRIMEEEGAAIIDVGAMSTAPYLDTVISREEEEERLKNALKVVLDTRIKAMVSVDTPRAGVADVALSMGADIVNDITGLKYDADMAKVIKEYNAYAILSSYSKHPVVADKDIITHTITLLKESIDIAYNSGIDDDKIIVDPAVGFFREHGKHIFFTKMKGMSWLERDIQVIRRLRELKVLDKKICISVSRKSFIGRILNIEKPEDRLIGSLAVEAICIMNGADIIRTHNVKESMQIVRIIEAIINK
jgi:dihydropteroate synthase